MTVHTVFIDSRDRDFDAFPTPTAYKVRLPRNYYNVTSARLMSAEIPRSFYEFTAAAGRTSFDIVVKGGSGAYTITIPDGNYTFMSMKTSLESALAYATGLTWTVLFSSTTNRMTMFNVELVDFSVTCAPQTDRPTDWGLAYYLGFAAGTTGNSSSGSLTSPLPARFHTTMYALLDIEELHGMDEGGLYGGVVGKRPFAKIPLNPSTEGYVMLDPSQVMFDAIPQRPIVPRLDSLQIRFRTHDNVPIDFNGVDHSFTLRLETRDREDVVMPLRTPRSSRPVVHDASGYTVPSQPRDATTAVSAASAASTASTAVSTAVQARQQRHRRPWLFAGLGTVILALIAYVYARRRP